MTSDALPTLAEYYRGGLRLVAGPGTRFTYGDHGFATLGQIIEDVSGKPLDRYFRGHIFEPLGMARSDLLRSAERHRTASSGPSFVRCLCCGRTVVSSAGGCWHSGTCLSGGSR
jgi:CubicO group peptidase (beta-lactamase class C family)